VDKVRQAVNRMPTTVKVMSLLVLASAVIGAFVGLAVVYGVDLPEVQELTQYRPMSDTELYDDEGRLIGSFALERRVIAEYDDYPKVLYDAVLSIEDKNFEKHSGFAVWRILGAAQRDIISGAKVQGASTLTMQLARNLFLNSKRTFGRKIQELLISIQIERRFTKRQIFTLYANQVFVGHGTYGLATGAQFYFGKSAKDLSLEEAALLAALLKAPNNYSPIKHPQRALERRNEVITAMLGDGKISVVEANRARSVPILLKVQSDPNSLAPYFVEEVRQYLENKYGSDEVHEAGLKVYTTLDMDMQKAATEAVQQGLAAYGRRHGGRERLQNARDYQAQGALLAIDNATGDIKAMVGGRDFNESKFNRATQALRQVGSSFKPYVYAAAVDEGAMPDDTVLDAPVTFTTSAGLYTPHNYDEKFQGTITLRQALADSRNIPAVKLASRIGIKKVIDYTRRFGIKRPIAPYLPIALGAVELTLLEHTSAFSAFPNDGVRMTPRYVLKVTDHDGRLLEENYSFAKDVLSVRTARIMTSMLRDVVLHGTAVAASHMDYALAGKTGTTNNFTDAWFIGFSPSITCGVWIGFDEKKSLGNKETGAKAALPVWMSFMGAALAKDDLHLRFAPPPALQTQAAMQLHAQAHDESGSEHFWPGVSR
jgi:penicillin-binding protein 1A